MKHTQRISFEWLCHRFKKDPQYLEWMFKECTLEVKIEINGYYKSFLFLELKSLDDVVQCILKYK